MVCAGISNRGWRDGTKVKSTFSKDLSLIPSTYRLPPVTPVWGIMCSHMKEQWTPGTHGAQTDMEESTFRHKIQVKEKILNEISL